jgi:hypothetical protein
MGSRMSFSALILAIALLGGMGFALIDQESKRADHGQTVVAAPLFGGDNVDTVTPAPPAPPAPAPPAPAPAGPAPPAPAPVSVAQPPPQGPCFFTLGFEDLRNRIIAAYGDVVGPCLENEHGNVDPVTGQLVNRDTLQLTANGLEVWDASTNTMRFTDGSNTWVYSACGLQLRPNTQTYVWETNAAIAAQAVPAPGTCELV